MKKIIYAEEVEAGDRLGTSSGKASSRVDSASFVPQQGEVRVDFKGAPIGAPEGLAEWWLEPKQSVVLVHRPLPEGKTEEGAMAEMAVECHRFVALWNGNHKVDRAVWIKQLELVHKAAEALLLALPPEETKTEVR